MPLQNSIGNQIWQISVDFEEDDIFDELDVREGDKIGPGAVADSGQSDSIRLQERQIFIELQYDPKIVSSGRSSSTIQKHTNLPSSSNPRPLPHIFKTVSFT